ncbi:MAG: transcription termination/antitermination NusG family protein [Wenzhouxiangella sp.]|jgi:transcriptional antiterminator RfaH|nr:transcription termination/antitermination NusG family protein [Wenzhouxiangella sp.]
MDSQVASGTYRWHAVFCKPRQDERAELHLRNQGFETFRPRTREQRTRNGQRRVIVESMFPRYLFVQLAAGVQDWGPIRSTRGAVGLVRHGYEAAVVPDAVIEELRRRCDENGLVRLAGTIDYKPDEPVEIIDGPCAGYRALFQARTGAERVAVLLTLLNHQRVVEVAEAAIRRA